MMETLPDKHRAALASLRSLLGEARITVIGAAALALRGRFSGRPTEDIDLAITASTTAIQSALAQAREWTAVGRTEHRWRHEGGALVDVVPATRELIDAGELVWPETGARMSLAGFALLDHGSHAIDPSDPRTQLASVEAVAVLKMAAYLDRPAERLKDLADLGHLLTHYLDDGDPRLYADDGPVAEARLFGDDAQSFLLGWDISKVAGESEIACARRFAERISDADDGGRTAIQLARRLPAPWTGDLDRVTSVMQRFMEGLDRRRAG